MSSPANPWAAQWAVVTGASSGIGRAIAEELAAGGTNLVLVARRKDRLEELASKLSVSVEIFEGDLGHLDTPRRLFEFTEAKGIQPELLVNNAGFGVFGEFCKSEQERQLAMVHLNCVAVVALTHLYLPGMVLRKRGDILIVASTASFQAVPYQSVYAATKAFDLIFAEGLAEEVKRHGVRVCALCPGMTESEFHKVANEPIPGVMSVHSAVEVARIGLNAMRTGKHFVVCGFSNMLGMEVQRLLPRSLVTRVSERLFRPKPIN